MKTDKYYKILTEHGANEATILLYGFIGEEYSYDPESDRYKMTGVTDIEFVKELSALAAQYPVIHIRINSPGGDFFHGNAIMTAIQNCPSEVHTWNDGIAASMAADIWMCGKVRHMAKNALLMIHPAWNICVGNAQDMRDCAAALDRMTESAIIATSASVGMTEDEMRAKYYADSKDHWLSFNDAVADGLVTETAAYDAAQIPDNVDAMSYKQLLNHFQKKDNPEGQGLMAQVKSVFTSTIKAIAGQKHQNLNTPVMDKNEFKKSLEDGQISREDALAVLKELEPAAPPPAPVVEDSPAVKALREEMEVMKATLVNTQKALAEYGAKPGDGKSAPAVPGEDHKTDATTASKELEDFNKKMAEVAGSGQNPHIGKRG